MKTYAMPLLACLLCGFSIPSAHAQVRDSFDRISTAELETIFKNEGYSYSIDRDGDFVWTIDGYKALIIIYPDKHSLQFHTAFTDTDATAQKINEWNRTHRYSRTYFDQDFDPVLELDLDLRGGVSRQRIKNFLKTSRVSLSAWLSEVAF